MATTNQKLHPLLQHPSHPHPLELRNSSNTRTLRCPLCHRKISSAKAYTCQARCDTYYYTYHRACVEAPPQIDSHPLHPEHPLPLFHGRQAYRCAACRDYFDVGGSSFSCDECAFNLDICCALSTLSEQITLPLHRHTLTSFSTRHDFVGFSNCYICQGSDKVDGYTCLRRLCDFFIHKRCIQDLYYADGTKAPRVCHGHPMEVFVGEDTDSNTCASCGSSKTGEFIGCETCQEFYHKLCFQIPEILRYPSHNPDHTLVLFPQIGTKGQCQSCASSLEDEIYYRCTSCEFFVHVGCDSQVLAYCEEGMSAEIELSWHKHPLLLCHRTKSSNNYCNYCEDKSIGPTYVCKEKDCRFQLHKGCTEIESTITHPHHPDHQLTLCERDYVVDGFFSCKACGERTFGLRFSCKCCLVDLDVQCAARFPTHKHYLHEHKLLRFEKYQDLECNRCGRSTGSPFFRCVPCDFNLHEECMELPQIVESKIHWHPLSLHETFLEDDSGEYYCEECEKTRDPRLGVYVCGHCKMKSHPRIYHIECVLPEIRKVYEKKSLLPPAAVEKLKKRIADKREEVSSIKEKLKEATLELDELEKQLILNTR